MKILFYARDFYPAVGGLETNADMLARSFASMGHQLRVVTLTPFDGFYDFPVPVIRQPSWKQLLQHISWCDVVFHNQFGVRIAIPAFALRKPVVMMMCSYIDGEGGLKAAFKAFVFREVLRRTRAIAVSQAVRSANRVPARVVSNAFNSSLFKNLPNVNRTDDLIFVGRLVSDKGLDVLLTAIHLLVQRRFNPRLTVIGDGPELEPMKNLANRLRCADRVTWRGRLNPSELVEPLNSHHIMVVPSRWSEPFGMVALEGLACGCVVVGSSGGGLPEAIGPCGRTFPNGDANALADTLADLLEQPEQIAELRSHIPQHLSNFSLETMAANCIEEMEAVLRS